LVNSQFHLLHRIQAGGSRAALLREIPHPRDFGDVLVGVITNAEPLPRINSNSGISSPQPNHFDCAPDRLFTGAIGRKPHV
jgi:hypothetical protein